MALESSGTQPLKCWQSEAACLALLELLGAVEDLAVAFARSGPPDVSLTDHDLMRFARAFEGMPIAISSTGKISGNKFQV